MKTSNFFFYKTKIPNFDRLEKLEENIGVWDLDGSKIYEGSVPEKEKIRDVGRAFSSFLLVVDGLLGNSDSSGISKEDFSRKIPLFLIAFCEKTETDIKKVVYKLFSYWFKNIQLKNIDLTYLKRLSK